MSRFCTKCGARLDDDARFCTSCGQIIDSQPQQAAEQPQRPVEQAIWTQPQQPVQQQMWTQPIPTSTGNWNQPVQTNTTGWTQPIPQQVTRDTIDWSKPTGDPNWNPDPPEEPEPQPQQWQQPYAPYPGQQPYQQPYQPPYQPYPTQDQNEGRGVSKGVIVGILVGVLALVGAVIAIVLLSNRKPTVEMNKYYKVTFSGYDGYGTAEVTFDSSKFMNDYEKKFKKPELAREFVSFAQYLPSLSKTSELKNDETVTLRWSLSEEDLEQWKKYYGIGFKCENREIKVANLTPIGTFDAFASLELTFEGNDGSGSVRIDQKEDAYYNAIYFQCDKYDKLSNGDTITVTCNYDERYMTQEFGKVPEATTKEYTVTGLGEIRTIDPFDYIEINYEGISPELTAHVQFKSDAPEELTSAVYINNTYFYDLKSGDEFTVEIQSWYDSDEQLAEYYGIAISEWSKTYTAAADQEYITQLSQISDDALYRIKSVAEEQIKSIADAEYGEDITMTDHAYIGLYLMTPKNEDQYYTQKNYLYVLYRIDVSSKNGGKASYYYYLGFENLIINTSDGSISFDENYYNTPSSTIRAGDIYLSGYDSLDTFRKSAIEYNSDSYNYETNVP